MGWHEVPGAAALGDDEAIGVVLKEQPVVLVRSAGQLHALHNVCTHQFALLSDGYVEDGCIECPLHQGRFDVRSGAATGAPAEVALATYPARLDGDRIELQID